MSVDIIKINKMGIKPKKISYKLIGLLCILILYCGYQWRDEILAILFASSFGKKDVLTFLAILILIILILFILHKEIRKSVKQNTELDKNLREEKEFLKKEVYEKTEELKKSRTERINELYRAAEFGKISEGLFHDLITPLTSILLHTENISGENTGKALVTEAHIQRTMDASAKMREYVKNIRSVLKKEVTEKMCDIEKELENIMILFSYDIKINNIEFKIKSQGDCIWYGNPLKFQQIFSNLISNAIDSHRNSITDKKEIEVILGHESNEIVITVQDNGCGISSGNINKIFDPFFTTKSEDRGTGIGLTIIKSIVENDLKGKMHVKSELGKGASFTISFPTQ